MEIPGFSVSKCEQSDFRKNAFHENEMSVSEDYPSEGYVKTCWQTYSLIFRFKLPKSKTRSCICSFACLLTFCDLVYPNLQESL